jgi:hypothetical protein
MDKKLLKKWKKAYSKLKQIQAEEMYLREKITEMMLQEKETSMELPFDMERNLVVRINKSAYVPASEARRLKETASKKDFKRFFSENYRFKGQFLNELREKYPDAEVTIRHNLSVSMKNRE